MSMNLPLLILGFGIFFFGVLATFFRRLINMPLVILFSVAAVVVWVAMYQPHEISFHGLTMRSSTLNAIKK